jgi:molybdopterin synthase catalytic subunit
MKHILLTDQPISPAHTLELVSDPASGGTVVFVGTVRNATKGKAVIRLEFEAYEAMAVSEMDAIAETCLTTFPIHHIAIHHRTGVLFPGDVPVVIAVAAAHRAAAFEACQYAIDTLKKDVPIWKKEVFEDGEVWVAAHP